MDKLKKYTDNSKMNNFQSDTRKFLNSDSAVAKFAFLFLVLFIFVVALRISTNFLTWLFSFSKTPHLLDGMIDAKHMQVIEQDPSQPGAIPVIRSNNQNGIEFTWSVWIFIEDLDYNKGTYKHIFHKGNDNINYDTTPTGLNYPNNGPGLYITPNKNNLLVIMNTFEKIEEKILIENVPLNKWINVIIRCEQKTVDCYINGTITKRHELSGVPFQNYGNVYLSMNGGFSGYTSNLWYYNYALGTTAIQNIVKRGPNTKAKDSKTNSLDNAVPYYFSLRWFVSNNGSQMSGYGGI